MISKCMSSSNIQDLLKKACLYETVTARACDLLIEKHFVYICGAWLSEFQVQSQAISVHH